MKPISRRMFYEPLQDFLPCRGSSRILAVGLLHATRTQLHAETFRGVILPNGVYPAAWEANSTPEGLQFGGSLAPLQKFASKSIVISGLNNPLGGHLGQTSGFSAVLTLSRMRVARCAGPLHWIRCSHNGCTRDFFFVIESCGGTSQSRRIR